MFSRLLYVLVLTMFATTSWGQGASRINKPSNPTTIIGPRNLALHDGAQALLAGDNEEGIRLTLEGLRLASGNREEEAALSNLCAGYIKLRKYKEALKYCDMLLTRNDQNWRGYNNRAVIYVMMRQYDKANADLLKGEELNPGAHTMKVARAMYMDAVHPVRQEVEIDDRDDAAAELADSQ